MASNSRHVGGASVRGGGPCDGLDQLPKRIRAAVWEAALRFDPVTILAHYNEVRRHAPAKAAEHVTLEAMQRKIDAELVEFSEQFKAAHGCDLPHVAARASIQRYGRRA